MLLRGRRPNATGSRPRTNSRCDLQNQIDGGIIERERSQVDSWQRIGRELRTHRRKPCCTQAFDPQLSDLLTSDHNIYAEPRYRFLRNIKSLITLASNLFLGLEESFHQGSRIPRKRVILRPTIRRAELVHAERSSGTTCWASAWLAVQSGTEPIQFERVKVERRMESGTALFRFGGICFMPETSHNSANSEFCGVRPRAIT